MPDLSRHTRTMLAAALLAATALSACGGDDDKGAAKPVAGATPTATQPATTDKTQTAKTQTTPVTPKPKSPSAKVIKVGAAPRSLAIGGLKVEVQVDSVIDPVLADVDEPQEGGRFVGVFLSTRASGVYEPAKVAALASLTTTDGKYYPVRVISGGECEGSFFPAAFVLRSKKPRSGCIGFDIPKSAQPKEIVLGVRSTVSAKQDTETWDLPDAK